VSPHLPPSRPALFPTRRSSDLSINPLVTESFGMDFDGDTVGIYAPRSRAAQKELAEKASIEANLIDPTSEKFTGNVAMDFVTMRSEEHTSELQSRFDILCRLLL